MKLTCPECATEFQPDSTRSTHVTCPGCFAQVPLLPQNPARPPAPEKSTPAATDAYQLKQPLRQSDQPSATKAPATGPLKPPAGGVLGAAKPPRASAAQAQPTPTSPTSKPKSSAPPPATESAPNPPQPQTPAEPAPGPPHTLGSPWKDRVLSSGEAALPWLQRITGQIWQYIRRLGPEAKAVVHFYRTHSQALLLRSPAWNWFGLSQMNPGRDMIFPTDERVGEEWHLDYPPCCIVCGQDTDEPQQERVGDYPDLGWTVMSLLIGLAVALYAWWYYGWLPMLLPLLVAAWVGYYLRRTQHVRIEFSRCEKHRNQLRYPEIYLLGEGLLVRVGARRVRLEYKKYHAQDREERSQPTASSGSRPSRMPVVEDDAPSDQTWVDPPAYGVPDHAAYPPAEPTPPAQRRTIPLADDVIPSPIVPDRAPPLQPAASSSTPATEPALPQPQRPSASVPASPPPPATDTGGYPTRSGTNDFATKPAGIPGGGTTSIPGAESGSGAIPVPENDEFWKPFAALRLGQPGSLPDRTIIGFVARTIRRVLPLYRQAWPMAPQSTLSLLRGTVAFIEEAAGEELNSVAAFGSLRTRASSAVESAQIVARETNSSNPTAHQLAQAVLHATQLAQNYLDFIFKTILKGSPEELLALIIESYVHVRRSVEGACVDEQVRGIVLADLQRIAIRARQWGWKSTTAITPNMFGPLWPEGTPDNWPVVYRRDPQRFLKTIVFACGLAAIGWGCGALFGWPSGLSQVPQVTEELSRLSIRPEHVFAGIAGVIGLWLGYLISGGLSEQLRATPADGTAPSRARLLHPQWNLRWRRWLVWMMVLGACLCGVVACDGWYYGTGSKSFSHGTLRRLTRPANYNAEISAGATAAQHNLRLLLTRLNLPGVILIWGSLITLGGLMGRIPLTDETE